MDPTKDPVSTHVESFILPQQRDTDAIGTVELISNENVVLIPIPSKDPRDPLNLPAWRRIVIMFTTSIFGTLALTVVSGIGAVIGFFALHYVAGSNRETRNAKDDPYNRSQPVNKHILDEEEFKLTGIPFIQPEA